MLKEHAIIFDLDGTLLNTLDDLHTSVNAAMKAAGLEPRTREEVRQFVGNGVMKLIERCVPGGQEHPAFKKAYGAFRMHYAGHCQVKTAPYDGIIPMLGKLRIQGVPVAVVSNKYDAAVKKLCNGYFAGLVPVAIGERDGVRKKPAPDTVLQALAELKMPVESAIYVGDSEVDIMTAKNAGIPCVSVSWGFKDRAFLEEQGAEIIVDSADQLFQILTEMSK
jgi:phosphoglycolate phosphatase